MCGVCYLKIPWSQPFWTVALRALNKKEYRNKTIRNKRKKVKKGYENIRQVNYRLKLGYDGSKLVNAVSKTGLDKFGSKDCD